MKILITNIGNRNIIHNSEFIPIHLFRTITEQLLKNFECEKEHIQLNILNTALDFLKEKGNLPDKVFIVVSNQKDDLVNNIQDTLYEGEIIKKLIPDNYSSIQLDDIITKEITGSVIDENYLMKFYQQFYTVLLQEYKDADFIFCDAGGTGQQKTAAKIMAEFMLLENQWKILYPLKDGSIQEKSQIEYRNIINKEQAIALVRKSQYEAALNILGGNINKSTDNKLFNLLSFTHFRSNKVLEKTKEIWNGNNIDNRKNKIIESAVDPEVRSFNKVLFDFFGKQKYLFLSEILLIAYHNYLTNNFRESILDFAVFYEEFINESLLKFAKNIANKKSISRDEIYYIINDWIKRDRNNCRKAQIYAEKKKPNSKTYDYTMIPLAIQVIVEHEFFKEVRQLAKCLSPHLDFSRGDYDANRPLNSVREMRNQIVHNGIYIDEKKLNGQLRDYETLLSSCLIIWGLFEEDIYEQLNKLIEGQIRNFG